jgi:hypothetical protein
MRFSHVGFGVKVETVLENCTTEEQRSVLLFLWTKRLNAKDIHEQIFCLRWEVFAS